MYIGQPVFASTPSLELEDSVEVKFYCPDEPRTFGLGRRC